MHDHTEDPSTPTLPTVLSPPSQPSPFRSTTPPAPPSNPTPIITSDALVSTPTSAEPAPNPHPIQSLDLTALTKSAHQSLQSHPAFHKLTPLERAALVTVRVAAQCHALDKGMKAQGVVNGPGGRWVVGVQWVGEGQEAVGEGGGVVGEKCSHKGGNKSREKRRENGTKKSGEQGREKGEGRRGRLGRGGQW
ncbi:hypothetical protein IAT38_001604 [Cryptococcus sp. DSM 104549]